jgi:hypothetical protein
MIALMVETFERRIASSTKDDEDVHDFMLHTSSHCLSKYPISKSIEHSNASTLFAVE